MLLVCITKGYRCKPCSVEREERADTFQILQIQNASKLREEDMRLEQFVRMNMPGEGSVIYNSAEKVKNFKGMSQPAIMPPHSSKAGKNYQQAFGSIHGFDPYAAGGYIPNYARVKDVPNTYMDVRAFKQFAGIRTGASSSNTKATGSI